MVVLDADRQVVRPAKLWNDTESAPDAGWLCGQLEGGGAAWATAVGSVPVASFTITKLSWLHRKEPEAWNRLAHVVLPHDWLTLRLTGELTGELVTDRGDASGTGYWSPATSDVPVRPPRCRRRAIATGRPPCHACSVRRRPPASGGARWSVRAPATTWPPRSAWRWASATPSCRSARPARCSACPTAPPPTPAARSRDSPTRPAATCRSSCTLNAAKVPRRGPRSARGRSRSSSTGWRWRATRVHSRCCRTSTVSARPNRPDATGVLGGLRTDVTREQLARAAVDGVVCGLLDGVDALAAHATWSGSC